jgi:hypothetical protein
MFRMAAPANQGLYGTKEKLQKESFEGIQAHTLEARFLVEAARSPGKF